MRIEKIKALSVESVVSENAHENNDDLVKNLFETLLGAKVVDVEECEDFEDCECCESCDICDEENSLLDVKDKIDKIARERFASQFKAKKVEKL